MRWIRPGPSPPRTPLSRRSRGPPPRPHLILRARGGGPLRRRRARGAPRAAILSPTEPDRNLRPPAVPTMRREAPSAAHWRRTADAPSPRTYAESPSGQSCSAPRLGQRHRTAGRRRAARSEASSATRHPRRRRPSRIPPPTAFPSASPPSPHFPPPTMRRRASNWSRMSASGGAVSRTWRASEAAPSIWSAIALAHARFACARQNSGAISSARS